MVKLNHCQLNNIHFKECKLIGINFSACLDFLFEVRFENCVLDYASFARKKMGKTAFLNTSMKNVDLSESDLTKATFTHADLNGALFDRTILKEADLTTAINYSIDPEQNNIKKAKFSLHGVAGLLHKYDITIE